MDNTQQGLGKFIENEAKTKLGSVLQLSEVTRIPRSTLIRHMGEPEKFTLDELLKISKALNLRPSKLTSKHYAQMVVST